MTVASNGIDHPSFVLPESLINTSGPFQGSGGIGTGRGSNPLGDKAQGVSSQNIASDISSG